MGRGVADCCRSHDWSTSVCNLFVISSHELDNVTKSWLSISPSTSVLWLLLCPSDGSVRVLLHVLDDLLEWPWAEGFDSQDCNVINLIILSVLIQIVVDLARAKDNFSNLVSRDEVGRLVLQKCLPSAVLIEVLQLRSGTLVSQKLLGSNNDQWLSEWQSHMSSEQVEIVCSVGWHGDFHVDSLEDILVVIGLSISWDSVILIAKKQVSLSSARGVLWSLTIISMWQEHDEAVLHIPFGFA